MLPSCLLMRDESFEMWATSFVMTGLALSRSRIASSAEERANAGGLDGLLLHRAMSVDSVSIVVVLVVAVVGSYLLRRKRCQGMGAQLTLLQSDIIGASRKGGMSDERTQGKGP